MYLQFLEKKRFKIRLIRLMMQRHQPTDEFNENIDTGDGKSFKIFYFSKKVTISKCPAFKHLLN